MKSKSSPALEPDVARYYERIRHKDPYLSYPISDHETNAKLIDGTPEQSEARKQSILARWRKVKTAQTVVRKGFLLRMNTSIGFVPDPTNERDPYLIMVL